MFQEDNATVWAGGANGRHDTIQISYRSGKRNIPVQTRFRALAQALAADSESKIVDFMLNDSLIYETFISKLFKTIKKEVQLLCSEKHPSILRNTDTESLQSFSWFTFWKEFEKRAPRFEQFLKCC
ncbi:hypothetical protein ScPMuIL_014684 [Solemya velum]